MSGFKNIAVAGATGNLGVFIVKSLLANGFNVTALARPESKATFDPAIKVIRTDYSVESLKEALKGQDGVVASFNHEGIPLQPQIVEAAAAVGVKRFLPSEFGFGNTNDHSDAFKPLTVMKKSIRELLEAKVKEVPEFSYTSLVCGAFIDWALTTFRGAGFDLPGRKVTIIDSGDALFSGTYLSTVGDAVAQVFLHPEETKNREVGIASITTTRNKLLKALKEEAGEDGWTIEYTTAEREFKSAQESFAKGEMMSGFSHMVSGEFFSDAAGPRAVVDGKYNDILGVKSVTANELARKCVADIA